MAKISDVYAGDYLQAAQLPPGRRHPAVIINALLEEIGQNRERKVVLSLARMTDKAPWPRGLVLNKTNAVNLATAFGDDTSAWIGRTIELWQEPTTYKGSATLGIRCAPHMPSAGPDVVPGAAAPSTGNGGAPPQTVQAGPGPNGTIPLPGPHSAPAPAGKTYAGPGSDLDDAIPF